MPKHMTALPSDKVWSLAMALIANGKHDDIRDAIIDAANQVWMISSGLFPGKIHEPELGGAHFVLRGDEMDRSRLVIHFDIGDVLESMMPLDVDVYERDDT